MHETCFSHFLLSCESPAPSTVVLLDGRSLAGALILEFPRIHIVEGLRVVLGVFIRGVLVPRRSPQPVIEMHLAKVPVLGILGIFAAYLQPLAEIFLVHVLILGVLLGTGSSGISWSASC